MSRRDDRAASWKAVAALRVLQSRAAEMATMQATAERTDAAQRHDAAKDALADAQAGWSGALEGGFDPGLALHWSSHATQASARETEARGELDAADAALGDKRNMQRAAEARAEAAQTESRRAVSAAARRRDEARLLHIEDRAARRRRLV